MSLAWEYVSSVRSWLWYCPMNKLSALIPFLLAGGGCLGLSGRFAQMGGLDVGVVCGVVRRYLRAGVSCVHF
jgi:hypothetical protein